MSMAFLAGALIFLLLPQMAEAIPSLQLFISEEDGGYYDAETQTWVTASDDFTLDAIVADESVFGGEDTTELILCVALDESLYSLDASGNVVFDDATGITIDGVQLTANDFEYGLPPISDLNPDGTGGDLGPHEIYPTAFTEIKMTIGDPGTYEFEITDASAGIHFDLYVLDENDRITTGNFAPFSHDAETVPPVPEPSTLMLLGSGALLLTAGKRFARKRSVC